jgi:hypothetical protein
MKLLVPENFQLCLEDEPQARNNSSHCGRRKIRLLKWIRAIRWVFERMAKTITALAGTPCRI